MENSRGVTNVCDAANLKFQHVMRLQVEPSRRPHVEDKNFSRACHAYHGGGPHVHGDNGRLQVVDLRGARLPQVPELYFPVPGGCDYQPVREVETNARHREIVLRDLPGLIGSDIPLHGGFAATAKVAPTIRGEG
jgi:hypothetical protein